MAAIGGHQRPYRGRTDDWLTPPHILQALGVFDLDPCAAPRQRNTARKCYRLPQDGLALPWKGRVWLNPPYGPETGKWLQRLAEHGNGIALIFARTETDMFFRYVWERAIGLLFLRGRLFFYHPGGIKAKHNSGGPSVLVAYGEENLRCLARCKLDGALVDL